MMVQKHSGHYVLLASCPFQKGIAAKLTQFVYDLGSEIVDYDQYADIADNHFYCRMEWNPAAQNFSDDEALTRFREEIAEPMNLRWNLRHNDRPLRLAVFVTRELAHLYALMMKCVSGLWDANIELIISNHPDLADEAARFNIPYHHLPIDKDNKAEQERRQLVLLQDNEIELIVLSRYMQVITGKIIAPYENRIINIHHSMLPAFSGAKPYHQAHARGVKLIGATSHYVTSQLDEGPIIAQEVKVVDHRKTVPELISLGRDLEANALARAVGLHINSRIIVSNGRTIVFD
jgi:formyltetrahydrofolate deformylase